MNKHPRKVKFMQTLLVNQVETLKPLAEDKGVTIQEYIRIFIVNEYIKKLDAFSTPSIYQERAKKGWETRKKNRAAKLSLPVNP